MSTEEKSPFTEHLSELRDRLIRSAIAITVGFCIAYFFKEKLFEILTAPLVKAIGDDKNTQMIFTGLPEAFFTYMKIAFLAGIAASTPVLFYEFWMFVSPGLYRNEKKYLFPIVLLTVFFFVVGSSFASKMLLAFGFIFELPLVLTFMARMGLVTVPFLQKNRKYAILIFFIVAAILTPPDVVSQILMAIPLMVLYEISIIGARVFGKKPDSETEENTESPENSDEADNANES